MNATWKTQSMGYVSLFTSLGTLLCCALPSLLVLVGMGATVASLVSTLPWLIALSRYKNWTFALAGLLIGVNYVYVYRIAPGLQQTGRSCPVDQPSACTTASRVSRTILWISTGIYFIGLFSAYLLGPVLEAIG